MSKLELLLEKIRLPRFVLDAGLCIALGLGCAGKEVKDQTQLNFKTIYTPTIESAKSIFSTVSVQTPFGMYLGKKSELEEFIKEHGWGNINAHQTILEATETIKKDPECSGAYFSRAHAKFSLGQYEEALVDIAACMDCGGKGDIYTFAIRGDIESRIGLNKQAIEDFDKVIEFVHEHINPEVKGQGIYFCEAYTNRGTAKYNYWRGKVAERAGLESALEDLDKAIDYYDRSAEAYLCRGVINHALGDKSDAIDDFEKALEINPHYELAKENLNGCLAENG